MALTKKGSRSIVVDGVSYRWLVRRKPTYDQFILHSRLLLAAERADVRGSTLVLTLPQYHPNSIASTDAVPVSPAEVADFIRAALEAGWKSDQKGGSFELTVVPEAD